MDAFVEPDRWHATVCNFLHLMAYEKNIEGSDRLYPTARLQIIRDLYLVRPLRLATARCCAANSTPCVAPPHSTLALPTASLPPRHVSHCHHRLALRGL